MRFADCAAGAAILCSGMALACPTPPDIESLGTVSTIRPVLRWSAVAGASHYRLTVRSRMPNGEILFAEEFDTPHTQWTPTQALTQTRAGVRVRVAALCHGQENAANMRFDIDATPLCRMTGAPQRADGGLTWPAVTTARRYELSHIDAEGKVRVLAQVGTPRWHGILTPGVYSVRPICDTGWGDPVQRVIQP